MKRKLILGLFTALLSQHRTVAQQIALVFVAFSGINNVNRDFFFKALNSSDVSLSI